VANTTITNLPVATTLTSAAVIPVVQGGTTYQATAGQVAGLYSGAATSLPAATAAQLYGGTGAAGVAQPVSVGTGLTLNPATHTLALTTPPSVASYVRTGFTATAGQATFTVAYTVGLVQIYVNGVLLNAADYTANNGTSVVLNVACLLGDVVDVVAFNNASGFLANIGPTGVLGVAGGGTGVSFTGIPDGQKTILLASVAVGSTTLTVSMPASWSATTAYTAGQMVLNNGLAFTCLTAGTSGTTGPVSMSQTGSPIPDGSGSLTWTYIGVAPTTASIFKSSDVGKSISICGKDIASRWSPWYQTTVGYYSVPTIVAYLSPTSVTVSRAGDVAPAMAPTFPNMSWPYSSTPSVIVWGTDNSTAINAAVAQGGLVAIPSGNFCVGKTIILPSNTRITGNRGSSVILSLGTGPDTLATFNTQRQSVFRNYAYKYWPTYGAGGSYNPNWFQTLAKYGDQNIFVDNITIDISITGLALGDFAAFFFLVKNSGFTNCNFIGTTMYNAVPFNFNSCQYVDYSDNYFENCGSCCTPWGGCKSVTFSRNTAIVPYTPFQSGVTYGGNGDPFAGMWFNIVGTTTPIYGNPPADDQISYDLLCTDNHIYIAGPPTGGAPNVGLGIFPASGGSIYYNFEISRNSIICGPGRIWPIFANGTGYNGIIADNIIQNCDGTAGPPISVEVEPANLASYTTITSVSCATGSPNITMIWPNHGYNPVWLSYSPVWFYAVGGPTFGGITISNYYRIVSATTNTIVFAIPSGGTLPTSPATVSWNGSFAQIIAATYGVKISNNQLSNCQSTSTGAIINTYAVACDVVNNSVSFTNVASPIYNKLIYANNINDETPGIIANNTGPTGTGSITAAGNNRVAFNGYEPTPVITDTQTQSWTPVLYFGSGNVGVTYSTRIGKYTITNGIVHFYGEIILTSKGTSTGNASIQGLPFPLGQTTVYSLAVTYQANMISVTNQIQGNMSFQSLISLTQISSGVLAALTNANFSDISYIYFSGWYSTV
jgi:hypothetical protein